ncbi:alpha/beta fold hydrolase [Paenibacillus macquariensis]|uniref:Pimeloyl-ACP methyl ester carboxylesterase n=1 Tax=Paenibacillus macquariensis TaxID=948756 RepID=A0ABY1JP27_9BACL|nr:alpha/beta hydrolase [Paenibacillus macquariensis]MEC0092068.1 alpha/beta hydrolase [Paenibacillus macquariensis]OAB37366.1 proline iminopeptidase [Paenibacillus macquariensis subsp. macquariensis]SIQ51713.1 Pimeloyl-ACP methyl ester carboxylesterase [Paenibacillus macquariensis]
MFTRRTPIIENAPNQIASLEKQLIGGVEQWLLIRGHDRNNPILLWIHGGPGGAQIGFGRQYSSDLEKDFVVVNWDQRGAGLSYAKTISKNSMTIDRMVDDLIEIVQGLCRRFHQQKIYLLGHSWGTILALFAVKRHPELFHGYFAISQVVNMRENERISYEFALRSAKDTSNTKAFSQLSELGPPPWNKLSHDHVHNKWLQKFGGGIFHDGNVMNLLIKPLMRGSEYRFFDIIKWTRGQLFSMNALQKELLELDLLNEVEEIKVPIAFCCGRYDYTAPSELAEGLYKAIQAPDKRWVWFENSAHSPIIEEQDLFVQSIRNTVSEWQSY